MTQPERVTPTLERLEPTLLVLEYLCKATGTHFDPGRAREALRRAIRDWQSQAQGEWPSSEESWQILEQAGVDCGIRLARGYWAASEAIQLAQPATPVVGLRPGAEPLGGWLILAESRGQQVLAGGLDDQNARWVSAKELAKAVGVARPEHPAPWAIAHPLAPFGAAPGDEPPDGGGQDGGHGDHGHHQGPSPFRRLVRMLRQERGDLWLVIAFAIGVGLLSLAAPLTVQAIVNSIITVTDPTGRAQFFAQQVIVLTFVLLGCLGLAALFRALKAVVVEVIQRRLFVRLMGDLAYRLPRAQLSSFDRRHGPELVNRFFDILTVQKAGSVLLLDGLVVGLQTLIGLVVLAFYHPYLLAFDLILLTCIAIILFGLGRGGVRTSIDESHAKYAAAHWLEEMVRHPLAFKTAGGQEFALERTDELARRWLEARGQHFRILLRQICAAMALQALASAALLGLGGFLVFEGTLSAGQLVAAELIVAAVVGAFVKLGKSLESFYDLMAAADKIGHLVDLPLERLLGERTRSTGPAALAVRGVSFAYQESHAGPIFEGLNLTIEPGECVALVGPHASGKSTLVQILYGLREPTSGRIELDGEDLRNLRPETLREKVALVQGWEVFDGTLLDNVRVGRPHLGTREVRQALEAVGLLEDLLAWPDGLNTWLTSGGAPLSAGQIRRVTLARAIAGKPRLLVLDEILDDMNPTVRARVVETLLAPDAPWTLLVVTHNPDVAALCDRQISLKHPASDRQAEDRS